MHLIVEEGQHVRIFNLHKNNESKFVHGLQEKLPNVQKQVFDFYSPKMLSICKSYISDFHYAEDCMINGFCKVFNQIHQFQQKGSFEGWVRRIMVNECLSFIRANQTLIFIDDHKVADFDDVDDDDFEFDAHQVLELLDNPYRLVFNLYVLENYSHQEIAQTLNISVSTSKTQLHRAKTKLKEIVLQLKAKQYEK